MNEIKKRFLLFLGLCIPSRIAIIFLSKNIKEKYLQYLSLLSLLVALGFMSIYIFDLRKTGFEVSNSLIWWNNLRPIHGVLYLLFSLYAFKKKKFSYMILILDVIIGIISFFVHHYLEGNFNMLI